MNAVYSEFLSLEWFWVLFPQKVPNESVMDSTSRSQAHLAGMTRKLDYHLKPLFCHNTTVFFLNADITIIHADSVFPCIKYFTSGESDNRLDSDIES